MGWAKGVWAAHKIRKRKKTARTTRTFVQTHGAGLFEVGVRIYESGGKRGWSDTPFGRVAWIPI